MSIANLPSRSPLGVFYRSKLGVFTNRPTVSTIEADGVGTASGLLTRTIYAPSPAGACFSRRSDKPFGTIDPSVGIACFGGVTQSPCGITHATVGPPQGNRQRAGFSFSLLASYPGATSAVLRATVLSSSVRDFYIPRVYLSSSDDVSLYNAGVITKFAYDWEGHADTLLQTSSGELQLIGGTQELIVPFGRITGALGRHLSFLQVTSTEVSGSGSFFLGTPDSIWSAAFSLELR